MDLEKIGKFIKEQRQEKGLTQKQIAENFGITAKAVSKWECGQNAPDIGFLDKLSEILDVTINEILTGCKDEEKRELEDKSNQIIEERKQTARKLKTKTIIEVFLIILVITAVSIAGFFGKYYSKYHDTCQIYKIYTQSTEFQMEGYIIQINNELMLILRDLMAEKKNAISNYELNIKFGDVLLYKSIAKMESENNFKKYNISKISADKKYQIEKMTIFIKIEYKDSKNKNYNNKIILKKDKFYNN